MTRFLFALPFCSLFIALLAATPALPEGLTVSADGLRNSNGKVLIIIFDKARAFETLAVSKAIDIAEVPAKKGSVRHNFTKLKKGPYAIFLFHDENGDDDLNATATKLLEGVGASGAPTPQDSPDFAAASVWPGKVSVRVHYQN